jgi:hypothetical protein
MIHIVRSNIELLDLRCLQLRQFEVRGFLSQPTIAKTANDT